MKNGKWAMFCVISLAVVAYWLHYDSFRPESVHEQRVLITGASAGIGEELAYHYSKLGASVLITARREHVLQKVVVRCKELGAQSVHYIALDASKPGDPERLIEVTKSRLGGLDQLILNHVSYDYIGLWNGDVERLRRVMTVNFESYVSIASLGTPLLEESGGSIGVISSGSGIISTPFAASYSSSKFALAGFFSSLRQEFILTNKNISITLCILGSIITQNSIDSASKYYRDEVKTALASDAAYAIMSGVTQRQREVYFPWFGLRLISLFRDWFPTGIDYLTRQLTKADALDLNTV